MKRPFRFITLLCAATGSLLILSPPAQATYIVTLEQVGANVVATGSGTLDFTGLSFGGTGTERGTMIPFEAIFYTGPATFVSVEGFYGISGPTSFGSGNQTWPNSGTGDFVGIDGINGVLAVPLGYVSGTALSDTATYNSATFSSLGVTPGTYVWTWGSGVNADSFVLEIVPDRGSTFCLLALSLTALVGASRLRFLRLANST